MKEYKVGIIGFGTVGAGVAENLLNNGDVIAKRTGVHGERTGRIRFEAEKEVRAPQDRKRW